MTPKQMQLKWDLEHSSRIKDLTGTMAVRYTGIPVVECAKQAIAHALLQYHLDLAEPLEQASIFLNEAEVILLAEPRDEHDTLPLLQTNQIEYPDFYRGLRHIPGFPSMQNTLRHLFCIWTVKGYHKKDPDTLIELLIGGYWAGSPLVPLGRRSGSQWISPAYPASGEITNIHR